MGQITRFQVVAYGVVANTILAIIWVRAGLMLVDIAKDLTGGTGPFTGAIGMLEVVVPVVIAITYIILFEYLVYGPVQDERARQVRRIR